jgi:hypothetical protein
MSEQELRDSKVPWIETEQELSDYIQSLANREHDYGTAVYAMSMAATAAFNYMAKKVGASGFQASCADLDVLRRTRHLDRFMIVNLNDALYPQTDLRQKLDEYLEKSKDYLREEAQKQLDKYEAEEEPKFIHPEVKAHWERLARA